MGISLLAQDQLRIEYELVEPEENFRDESLSAGIEIFIPKRYYELIVNQEETNRLRKEIGLEPLKDDEFKVCE